LCGNAPDPQALRRGHASAGGADPFAEKPYAMHAHGAVFAEVKVDPELG
jgi:hypothetical protein